MSGRMLAALLAGGAFGFGALLLLRGLRVAPREDAPPRWTRAPWQRLGLAMATAIAVLVVTRWVVAAIAAAALAVGYERLFGGARTARRAITRLEALAGWTESLRDMVATGLALPESLVASAAAASPEIRPQLESLADRLRSRESVEDALRALADELDDAGADLVIAALILNARAQGRALQAVLGSLARAARAELAVRRSIDAERRSTRRAVQFVVGATVLTALGLAVGNPAYVEPYRGVAGQAVLAVVVGIFGVGFTWLSRLSAMPAPARFLSSTGSGAR